MPDGENIPTVKGTVIHGMVKVECPFCHGKHYHGKALLPGDRQAHCLSDHPDSNKSYYIELEETT